MTILFVCPHCKTKSQIPDQYAGQSGPCAACGKNVAIPYAGSASSAGGGGGTVMTIIIVLGLVFGLMALCVVGGGALLFFSARSAVQGAAGSAQRMQSQNNLKQIGIALHTYHDANGALPPPVVKDPSGKPLYSWRVLILPYLGEDALYRQFNLNEVWDSPANMAVSQRMPRVFQSPSQTGAPGMTDYLAFVGPETAFDPEKKGGKLTDIIDGTSNTILVTEVKGSSVNWAEPRDIEFSKSSWIINSANNDIGSANNSGCNVLLGDGSVKFLDRQTPPGTLRSMATKAGGEIIPF